MTTPRPGAEDPYPDLDGFDARTPRPEAHAHAFEQYGDHGPDDYGDELAMWCPDCGRRQDDIEQEATPRPEALTRRATLTLSPTFGAVLVDAVNAAMTTADAEGTSRAFSAMRTEVVALRDRALAREGEHAAIHGAASPNGWTYKVAAFDEVLSVIDETEEMS